MIIIAECITALIYLYLGLSLPWSSWSSADGLLREVHFLAVVLSAVAVAFGTARRRPWATKGAVVLAAYTGLPHLATIAALVQAFRGAETASVVALAAVVMASLAQLVAFFVALSRLRPSALLER